MNDLDKLTSGKMNEEEEKIFLESAYEKFYDKSLKSRYAEKLKEEYGTNRTNLKGRSKILWWVIGASVLVIIFLSIRLLFPDLINNSKMDAQSYAQNLITIDKMDVNRGNDLTSKERRDLISAYNSGDHKQALLSFDLLPELSEEDKYYKARLLLFQRDYLKAIDLFNDVKNKPNFRFNTELKFWLAVAYISNNNTQAPEPLLRDVLKSKWKSVEVNELLNKIK